MTPPKTVGEAAYRLRNYVASAAALTGLAAMRLALLFYYDSAPEPMRVWCTGLLVGLTPSFVVLAGTALWLAIDIRRWGRSAGFERNN